MKNIVITGATSFLGRNVLKALLDKEYYIYALVRKESKDIDKLPVSDKIKYIYGDVEYIECLENYVKEAEYFLNFAWCGSGAELRKDAKIQHSNVGYAMRALELAKRLGCKKFLFPGSQAEYGIQYDTISEMTECKPKSEYGKAKYIFGNRAREYCEENDIDLLHLRIFSVYGYGDRENTLVDLCVKGFSLGKTVKLGPCRQRWNYLYIDDFAKIVVELLENEEAIGIVNVAGKETKVLKEFVEEIYNCSNRSGSYICEGVDSNPEGSPNLIPDITRMEGFLQNVEYTSFSEGVRKLLKNI